MITVQFNNKDLQFQSKEGVQKAVVNIYGRITTLTRRMAVSPFEDTVTVDSPPSMLQDYAKLKSIYQKNLPLKPGLYRLNVVAKDLVGGNMQNYEIALTVPAMDAEKLSSSTLILADLIENVPDRSIGAGMFVIGSNKVRPRVDDIFKREEKLGIYMKVYNFGGDETNRKPTGQVEYELTRDGSNDRIFDFTEDFSQYPDASMAQLTIAKIYPLKDLEPGKYTIHLKITDRQRKQTLTPSAQFTVT
jgi:hypothetical protein